MGDDEPPSTRRGIVITDRDIALCVGLFESRIMDRWHIAEIFFDGAVEGAKKRLPRLRAAGLIREQNQTRARTEPAIYALASKGFEAIRESAAFGRLTARIAKDFQWKKLEDRHNVSPMTLRHELAVVDVRAALHKALRRHPQYALGEFVTWPLLCQFEVRDEEGMYGARKVRPDGLFRIDRRSGDKVLSRFCFLEVDRGSEVHTTLIGKTRAYVQYNGSPEFARFLLQGESDKPIPFRTLMIFAGDSSEGSQERMFNHAHWISRMEADIPKESIWLTTHESFVENPLAPIWICPEDYQAVLAATPYDPKVVDWSTGGRALARDALLRRSIEWRTLLPDGTGGG